MAEINKGNKIYYIVNGTVVAELESLKIKPFSEDQILRAMGLSITIEELAEFRRQLKVSSGGNSEWQVKVEEPKLKAQDMN